MKLRSPGLAPLAGLLACAAACAPMSEPDQSEAIFPEISFEVGQRFPELAFPALDDGRPVSLAEYRGQKVLLHIFASW